MNNEKNIIYMDGVKYYEWIPKDEVIDFEPMVHHHAKDVFGENCDFFQKKQLITDTNLKAIPDGYIVDFKTKKWFIVELKLLCDDAIRRIPGQIIDYKNASNNSTTKRQIYKAIKKINNDSDLDYIINDTTPCIIVVINSIDGEMGKQFIERVKGIDNNIKILVFRTFARSFVDPKKVHIHLFTPMYDIASSTPPEITPIRIKEGIYQQPTSIRPTIKITWCGYVEMALRNLGGTASLRDIYSEVKRLRKENGEIEIKHPDSAIRNALEKNSRGEGKDIFDSEGIGTGIWKIK